MNSELGTETQAEAVILMPAPRAECIDPFGFTGSARAKTDILACDFFFFLSESDHVKILAKYLNVLMAMAKILRLTRKMGLKDDLESAFSGW